MSRVQGKYTHVIVWEHKCSHTPLLKNNNRFYINQADISLVRWIKASLTETQLFTVPSLRIMCLFYVLQYYSYIYCLRMMLFSSCYKMYGQNKNWIRKNLFFTVHGPLNYRNWMSCCLFIFKTIHSIGNMCLFYMGRLVKENLKNKQFGYIPVIYTTAQTFRISYWFFVYTVFHILK